MKKFLAIVLALVMALSLVACGSSSSDESEAVSFKLGGHGPLTGAAALYGNAAANGAQIAVDEINELEGYAFFELNYQDDAHDAEKAANAYNALKDWGMQISLGGVTSKPCQATAGDHYSDRIFALTPSASAPAVLEGNDNVFQMCFSDPNQGSASAEYISGSNLGTKIAIIWKNDDVYSKGIYDKFVEKAEELGLEIVSDQTFADGNDTDFSVQLTDAQKNGADLIFLPIYYTPASLILAKANEMGYTPKFFGVDGMDGILELEGFDVSLAEGVMLLTPFNADDTDEKTVSFVTKYKEAYGETPIQFAADSYDCVYAYYQALKAAGCTPDMSCEEICDAMIEQFTTMSFEGLTSVAGEGMTWDETGAVSKAPKGMVIENGTYVGLK